MKVIKCHHIQAADDWKWTGQICLHQSFSPELDGTFEEGLLLFSICCALSCIASNLGVCKVTPLGWKQAGRFAGGLWSGSMPFTATGETRVWISEPGYNITKCRAQDEMGCRSLMALYETEIKRWWGNSSDCRSSWAHISLKEHGENSYRRSSLKKQGRAVVC